MKIKAIHVLSVLLGLSFLLTSCDDDKRETKKPIYDLSFSRSSYTLSFNNSSGSIPVQTGNGAYDVIVTDKEIVEAELTPHYTRSVPPHHPGFVYLNLVSTGKKNIIVIDKLTGQWKELEITVLPPYLSLYAFHNEAKVYLKEKDRKVEDAIKADILKHKSDLLKRDFMLMKDDQQTLYVLSEETKTIHKGNYLFEKTDKQWFLHFTYPVGNDAQTYTFSLPSSGSGLYSLGNYFELWKIVSRSDALNSPPPYYLEAVEDYTETYQSEYPQLEWAQLITLFSVSIPVWVDDALPKVLIEELLAEN